MVERPRVLVIGAGPAGLSAGVHLLEQAGGRLRVEMVTMGHHLGGKAKSWKDEQGFTVDHGFHAVFGFYDEMKSLASRAGVDLSKALVKSNGRTRFFSPARSELFMLQAARNPWVQLYRVANLPWLSPLELKQLADAVVRMAKTISRVGNIEAFDDVCYRAFLLEHGAPPSFLGHPFYRQVQELIFNEPYDVSAYVALKGAELLAHCFDDAAFHYVAGGLSELFWEPISRYFTQLGGTQVLRQKLLGFEHRSGKLTGCQFGTPDNAGFHQDGKREWPDLVPTADGSCRVEKDVAAVICTVPAACFVELNDGDQAFWSEPAFAKVKNLRSVSTLSLQLWLQGGAPRALDAVLSGLPLPLGYVVDLKQVVPEFRRDRRYGAALEWVGAEAGFEERTDDQLVGDALAALGKVPGCHSLPDAVQVHRALRRNRGNHARYLLTEPGTLRFRPTVKTPLDGLFLAGDWVRNEIDIPTMEGAIRCGKAAAHAVLEAL